MANPLDRVDGCKDIICLHIPHHRSCHDARQQESENHLPLFPRASRIWLMASGMEHVCQPLPFQSGGHRPLCHVCREEVPHRDRGIRQFPAVGPAEGRIHSAQFAYRETVMESRKHMFAGTNINMIPVSEDMSHLFAINKVLDNGETLSMPADRIFGSQKSVSVSFLGAPAEFPLGPFIVATMRGLDALAVNVMKTSSKGYKIYVTPLSYNKEAPRKQQIAELVQSYVQELERMLKMYPTQWYNFFDFWK